jgi:hypothetical protein
MGVHITAGSKKPTLMWFSKNQKKGLKIGKQKN